MSANDTSAAAPSPARRHYASLVEVPYRRKLFLVAALTVTLFVTTMNQSVVSTAAQNIVGDLGRFELFTWLFAGFSLAGAVAVPIIGKLSDMVGRKPVMLASLAIFLVASAGAGMAQDMPQLIAARVVQGIGFSGALGSVWIIMAALWEPRDRAKWMGVTATGFTLSGVLGPVVGGVVSETLSWRWIFYMNLPIGGAAFALLLLWFPSVGKPDRRPKFDIAGAATFALFASLGLFTLSAGGEMYAWGSPVILGMIALSFASLVAFLIIEPRAADPVVPLGMFKSRVFSGAMVASVTITVTFAVITVFMPLYVQGVRGQSATIAALPLIANAIGVAIGTNLGGQIISRRGYVRELGALGLAIATVSIASFGLLQPDTPMGLIVGTALLLGIGASFGFTAFTVPVQNAMPQKSLGVVTTSLQFARVLGMAVASATLGALLLAQLSLGGAASGDPREDVKDPEVLVSSTRLAEVREKFEGDPALGRVEFESSVAASRADLNSAIRLVFRVAAVVSSVGVAMAFVTFADQKGRRREVPGPVSSKSA